MEVRGFLKDLKDWDYVDKDKDQTTSYARSRRPNAGKLNGSKGPFGKVQTTEIKPKANGVSEFSPKDHSEHYSYLDYSDKISNLASINSGGESLPDAVSEKELGNEYFKQKKFIEAIDCYSRSIALSPTSVAFANRAMAYLKLKRFEEAENDCTEALNLDDRYVKAYSRRATARKELGKLKESMEDADFAVRLEPNNQEVRKQYSETKSLYEKEVAKTRSGSVKASTQESQRLSNLMESKHVQGDSPLSSTHQKASASAYKTSLVKQEATGGKNDPRASVQDLASRAASRLTATAAKNITAPKSSYEFEVSWRALSDDCALQAKLLKMIPPSTLPQIFKNALSAPILIDIIKCISTFIKEDCELAVSILDNMIKVPRFDMIIMCLSVVDHSEVQRIWEEVFLSKDIPVSYREALTHLQPKYCPGDSKNHALGLNQWAKDM